MFPRLVVEGYSRDRPETSTGLTRYCNDKKSNESEESFISYLIYECERMLSSLPSLRFSCSVNKHYIDIFIFLFKTTDGTNLKEEYKIYSK